MEAYKTRMKEWQLQGTNKMMLEQKITTASMLLQSAVVLLDFFPWLFQIIDIHKCEDKTKKDVSVERRDGINTDSSWKLEGVQSNIPMK